MATREGASPRIPFDFLFPLVALAVDAAEPPAETNMIGTIVFLLLFVGGCAAFAWMIWRNETKSKQNPGK